MLSWLSYSGADSIGHGGGTCPHPAKFYKRLGTGDTVSRRTADKKLIKLCWPSRKHWPKRLIVFVEPREWRGTTTTNCPALCAWGVPPPALFHIRSGATAVVSYFCFRESMSVDALLFSLSGLCVVCAVSYNAYVVMCCFCVRGRIQTPKPEILRNLHWIQVCLLPKIMSA